MAKRKFTIEEVTALKKALNEPITIDGKSRLPLEHAIHRNNLPLFNALLRLGADSEQTCIIAKDKKSKSITINEYLRLKVASEPLAYKQFTDSFSDHKVRKTVNTLSKYTLEIAGVVIALGVAVFNVGMILKTFLPTQAATSFITSVLSHPVTTPIFGIAFNTAYLAYRSYKNFSNPAKTSTANIVSSVYDLIAFGLNTIAYASYFVMGASPFAGALFVAASLVEATRGVSKLVRAFRHRSQFKAKLNDPDYMANEVEATKTIRSYQRTNYKIATNVMRMVIAVAVTAAVAVYCFMPLSLIATGGVLAGMGALSVAGMIATSIFDKFFEHRAKKQIEKYKKTHSAESSKENSEDSNASYKKLTESLDLDKKSSNDTVVKLDKQPKLNKRSKKSGQDNRNDKKNQREKSKKTVSLQSKTRRALTLFDEFQKKHTDDQEQKNKENKDSNLPTKKLKNN